MKYQCLAICMMTGVLSACSGSDYESSVQPYHFINAPLGAQSKYSEISVDTLNNTNNTIFAPTISAVNTDGSFVASNTDPTSGTLTTGYFNNAGQETAEVTQAPNAAASTTCNYAPHSGSMPSPLVVLQGWNISYTQSCDVGTPLPNHTGSGQLVDIESIIVPAGKFRVYKFKITETSTDNLGTTVTKSTIDWLNADSKDSRLIKSVVNYTYTGTAPVQPSPVSITRELQSYP